ncbi:cytochrome D ubiquinol oxidase subunit I [Acidihalobacter yilgarnensis]|uniref:Cytochrome D ubiquinol oxidase subunit I n=1 Tax=Acidihalobacter yilgarnensis TaxID=2819280 RepID=A0A1D8IN79_9GAMM|nr:cytochrome ubiquinol oxidase subunit I [Acidihalobacter yilgarnensis]AOU97922.1 cytochrome D ubiquinol oxidase subunit I [Acidihalobacter yilgarnensis]
MLENSLSVLLSRLDFAWITSMHILYPPLTIGLSLLLFIAEWRWVRTGDEHWYRLTRFFEKLFIINFGAGVATGVTMEMAFGILYGPFSQAAGPFFGNILGYETITAFMYEAGFVGLMIFGWGKIGKRMHLFATFNVMLSSSLSAMWILVANSWMQTPTGVTLQHGIFMVHNWVEAILNPDFIFAFPHMWIAAVELALFFVAGISAWFMLRNRNSALFQRSLKYSLIALLFVTPLQIYLGDGLGRVVAQAQPAALAAMEGHYHTYNSNGSVNSGWHIIAWPNDTAGKNDFAITLPHVLSLLETHTLNGKVTGLDQFKPADRPPVLLPFYSFRVMVAIGFFLFIVALWGAYLILRGRLDSQTAHSHRGYLRILVFSAFLPYAAIWTGWWTREIARQPWVVYGLMKTSAGVSKMSVGSEILWLVCFAVFELLVWGGAWYFFAKVIRKGPDMESPVIEGGHEPLGHLERPSDDQAHPEYVRPVY